MKFWKNKDHNYSKLINDYFTTFSMIYSLDVALTSIVQCLCGENTKKQRAAALPSLP
jgi:hypothetical protein